MLDTRGCARLGDLRGCFGREGAKFRGAGEDVDLRAVAWGREGKLQKLRWRSVGREGNREVYRGRGIEAWWRAVPLGYEEGFELLRRPRGRGAVEVELEANRVGRKVGGGLRWGGMRYGKLWVTDGRGRRVPAVLREEGRKIWIRIEGRGWEYPLRIDPLVWVEQAAVLPSGLTSGDELGFSVALSGNGEVAIVWAYGTNNDAGAAYVYTYDSSTGTWSTPAALSVPSGYAVEFGNSVALSSDGEVAIVGAPDTNSGAGAAYIYTYDSSTENWSTTTTLSAPTTPSRAYSFGASVALSSDGDEALVGAYGTNGDEGAAYVYTYDSSTGWSSTPVTLSASCGGEYCEFGNSVALSGNGEVALVGAVGTNSNVGAAYVYTNSGAGWSSPPTTLFVPGGANFFGISVALSSNGEEALVGARGTNSGAGAAYVYTNSGTGWSSTPATLSVPSGAGGFGNSVALSSDGEVALVGAPGTNSDAGAASFYGEADLDLALDVSSAAAPGGQYTEQAILTNDSGYTSPNLTLNLPIPGGTNYQSSSASSTQGSCTASPSSGVVSSVSCDVGTLAASGGSATASVTLGVPSNATAGTEITETANVANTAPTLSAQSTTVVVIAPTLSGLADETVTVGATVPSESFTIGGTGALTVTVSSSNPTLLPDSGIGGYTGCTAAGSCTLTLSPVSGQVGTTAVTVTVEDDYGQETSASFALTVNPPRGADDHGSYGRDGGGGTDRSFGDFHDRGDGGAHGDGEFVEPDAASGYGDRGVFDLYGGGVLHAHALSGLGSGGDDDGDGDGRERVRSGGKRELLPDGVSPRSADAFGTDGRDGGGGGDGAFGDFHDRGDGDAHGDGEFVEPDAASGYGDRGLFGLHSGRILRAHALSGLGPGGDDDGDSDGGERVRSGGECELLAHGGLECAGGERTRGHLDDGGESRDGGGLHGERCGTAQCGDGDDECGALAGSVHRGLSGLWVGEWGGGGPVHLDAESDGGDDGGGECVGDGDGCGRSDGGGIGDALCGAVSRADDWRDVGGRLGGGGDALGAPGPGGVQAAAWREARLGGGAGEGFPVLGSEPSEMSRPGSDLVRNGRALLRLWQDVWGVVKETDSALELSSDRFPGRSACRRGPHDCLQVQ